jgi:hypothetical protein
LTERFDEQDRDWPTRPWILAAIGAVGGLIIHLLTDHMTYSTPFPVWKQAATTFTAVAVLAFLLTVELRRWTWAIAFAVGWGAVLALVGWFSAQYNHNGEIMEFPFLSGILAVLIAAPLFQTIRDEGAWRFPYARLHRHAWTDAVIGAASIAFTGVTFLLAWLIAGLFNVIGIDAIKDLLQEEWFCWMLAGFAFGGAVGILRERDALVATLQKLVMVVFSVLAPVLAVALVAFLLSLPFTGLKGLWESDIPATPLLLLSGAGAILLANAVIGNGREERSANMWLRRAALLLVACVLPLAFFAALSMGQRIGQYGWTPERIWGVIAVAIAIAYGAAGWWAVYKGRQDFDDALRPLQTDMAIGLCGLALILALPIFDFGAISARSQLARLHAGKVKVEEFDWRAMAFDFGPEGRERLAEIAKAGAPDWRKLAGEALKAENRYDVDDLQTMQNEAQTLKNLRVDPAGHAVPDSLRDLIVNEYGCHEGRACLLLFADEKTALLAHQVRSEATPSQQIYRQQPNGSWVGASADSGEIAKIDPAKGKVEIRQVQRRQLYVDGKPAGPAFE